MPLWIVWQTSLPTASTLHCTPALRLRISINTHGNATESSEKGAVTGEYPHCGSFFYVFALTDCTKAFLACKGSADYSMPRQPPLCTPFSDPSLWCIYLYHKGSDGCVCPTYHIPPVGISARGYAPLSFPHFCPACRDSVLIDFP